jgi:hypothetical protein
VDEDFTPIAGAIVELNFGTFTLDTAITDIFGNYRIDGISTGTYTLRVRKTGYESAIRSDVIVRLNKPTREDFILGSNPATVYGQVIDSVTTNGIANALVKLNFENLISYTALTDPNGNYLITGIGAGHYVAHVDVPSYEIGITSFNLNPGPPCELNFSLTPDGGGSISGKVEEFTTFDPIPGAFVFLYYKDGDTFVNIYVQITNADGEYNFTGLPDGDYYIIVRCFGYEAEQSGIINPTTEENFLLKKVPDGPLSISGAVDINRVLMQADRIHAVRWQANPLVVRYAVYRNNVFLTTVFGQGMLEYQDHNRNKNITDLYTVYSVSELGTEGGYLEVSLR